MKAALLALFASALAVPAFADGAAQATFRSTTAGDVSGRVAAMCIDRGYIVQEATPSSVTCEVPMKAGSRMIAGLAIGTRYGTPPKNLARFIMVQIGPDVRVQAQEWVEATTAFGQTNREPLDGGSQIGRLQAALSGIGGEP